MSFMELQLLLEELFQVANLSGNVGKTVKRLIDRTFGCGLALDLSKPYGVNSPLGFALYLRQVQELVAELNAPRFAQTFLIEMRPQGLGYVTVFVKANAVPEGMRDRQALLREGRDILQNFVPLEGLHLCDLTESFFGELESERGLLQGGLDELREPVLAYFRELLGGGQVRADHPRVIAELAELLVPAPPRHCEAVAA